MYICVYVYMYIIEYDCICVYIYTVCIYHLSWFPILSGQNVGNPTSIQRPPPFSFKANQVLRDV